MATIIYELGKPQKNGDRKVSFILTHKSKRKRLPCNIVVQNSDLSRSGKITSRRILKNIEDKLNAYRDQLYDLDVDILGKDVSVEWICERLEKKSKSLDFFEFADEWMQKATCKGIKNYRTAINSFKTFIGDDRLSFASVDFSLLNRYKLSLDNLPRAQSLYLGAIRHIFKQAMLEYNSEYEKLIPYSPFDTFQIPKHTPQTKDRVVTEADLIKIFNFKGTNRVGLARDCYILSFCLMGMNSVDLYKCTNYKKGILSYERAKTKDRRTDNAYIEIVVPELIKPLFRKYKGTTRVFDFYTRYSNEQSFNKNLNIGLKAIAKELGIPPFDFYSARHTWASIARNKLGIDKYTIHEALNHVSELDITDIYIQRDFSVINEANAKVISYIMKLQETQD